MRLAAWFSVLRYFELFFSFILVFEQSCFLKWFPFLHQRACSGYEKAGQALTTNISDRNLKNV